MKTTDVVGMLHVPINTLLAAPPAWREALNLPNICPSEWDFIGRLEDVNELTRLPRDATPAQDILHSVFSLSFAQFLRARMLTEADIYLRNGITNLMIENIGAPYFVRGEQPAIIYWVMCGLAKALRDSHPPENGQIGIQVLAFSDDWAMDIACRTGLDFIRCESAVFAGIRPEGHTPNHGNLAKLYQQRAQAMAGEGRPDAHPKVFVDLQKKHTIFPAELESLDTWLDQLIFEKLEGVILTGYGTGLPVKEEHLIAAREAIDQARSQSYFPEKLDIPLLIGSGVSLHNLAMCVQYADHLIVGSALKQNGYWECPLDESRVQPFMDAFRSISNKAST